MKFSLSHILPAVGLALSVILLPGCFTGIESTARIKDTSGSSKTTAIAPEQAILACALPQKPRLWQAGKPFLVAKGRYDLAYTPASLAQKLTPGDTLRLISMLAVPRLSGDTVTDICLSSAYGTLTHRIDVCPSQLLSSDVLPLPFAIEADAVTQARAALTGLEVWNLKADAKGRKFSHTTITEVLPGSAEYPFTVVTYAGDTVLMSPRTFANHFSFSDPRSRYPQISDDNWQKIINRQVAIGMTRDECRLALGAPANIEREAAYNALIERWTYENGIYLLFSDGILTSFRK